MDIRVGTSGYSYAPWKGRFYPAKLPAAQMLAYYATKLRTVEINNTFYRLPAADVVTRWAQETPADFVFAVKSPKRITHDRRLLEVDDVLARFAELAGALGAKLGPVLFQLPPFQRKDLPRLHAFLTALAATAPALRAAFEFRHVSWFDDEVYDALGRAGAALCLAEDEKLSTPRVATTSWGYARLRKPDYTASELADWVRFFEEQKARWGQSFVFFKHEDEAVGPRLATEMVQLLAPAP